MAKKGKITDDMIWAYALKNAIEHKGQARIGSIISALFNEGLQKSEVKTIMPRINKVLKEVNDTGLSLQKVKLEEYEKLISHREVREGLPELPGAKKGKVVMRTAPSASGPLHLPHGLCVALNYLYVKRYGGKFYVRIEDTNPETVYKPAYEMIADEAKWLTKGKAKVIIQSDRMELYYKYAEKLIKAKAAYVCTCSAEEFKNLIEKSKACACRANSVKENTERWKKMLANKAGYKPGQAVLRFKANLKDKNPAMRDFPLARVNTTKHPKVGTKYRVWPLMNLAVSVDDIDLSMTHIIRGKDHRDNSKRQEMIYKVLKKKMPWTAFLGMLHFKDAEFSTRKMKADIAKKKYKGWSDPKLDTVASLRKRKYKPEVFWKFAEHKGISEVDKVIDKKDFFEILDKFNK